jgi:hypothetical protein
LANFYKSAKLENLLQVTLPPGTLPKWHFSQIFHCVIKDTLIIILTKFHANRSRNKKDMSKTIFSSIYIEHPL